MEEPSIFNIGAVLVDLRNRSNLLRHEAILAQRLAAKSGLRKDYDYARRCFEEHISIDKLIDKIRASSSSNC